MKTLYVLLIIIFFVFVYILYLNKHRKEELFEEQKENIDLSVEGFNKEINPSKYISHSDMLNIKDIYLETYKLIKSLAINKKHPMFQKINSFIFEYENLESIVNDFNIHFIESEKEKYNDLFSNIDRKSLDDQQRTAVITDEDSNLVVAGAGSGKTLTISGKVKYLCETKDIKPEQILLMSFTKKAAKEMTERIATKLNYNVEATTFHKLGLDILKEAKGKNYDVKDDMPQFFEDYFSTEISKNTELLKNIIEFFAYYLELPSDLNDFDSLGDLYEHEKSVDLETIKSKYDFATYTQNQENNRFKKKLTLKNEKVKSLQEIEIANFLFLNGIKYEYEPIYPYQDKENTRKTYHPDFYLSEYDIYIEHFGINEDTKCPWLSEIEEEKYIDDMNWKIDWHNQHNTKLIQTYSYYFSKGILLTKLEELLKNEGVKFKKVDLVDVFNTVYQSSGKKYFSEFTKLCCTFISLFKSRGLNIDDLPTLDYKSNEYRNDFFFKRAVVFKDIIKILLVSYDAYLRDNNSYDFSDMINLSAKAIEDGFKYKDYKYIIIDEFQDISVARYKLIKALIDQTKAKLLCVGDDWQSIYRFTGSDISLFTDFKDYFGYSKIMKIEKTYRNSQQLIDGVTSFIEKNPQQIKKDLVSDKIINKPLVFWHYKGNPFKALEQSMDAIINEFGEDKDILLLGRTSYDFEIVSESKLFNVKNRKKLEYCKSPNTPIKFMTVHSSKGLEADNVVLLNFENATMGFPNKIADDPMLELVLNTSDKYMYGEERRLLYVALTRTKNKNYILTNAQYPSEFLKDFPESENIIYLGEVCEKDSEKNDLCPKCKKGHLVIRINEKTGRKFAGCSNYPKCDYTVNSIAAIENRKICPDCGGYMVLRFGKTAFWGCSNYPKCNCTQEFNEIKFCPECGSEMIVRKGINGPFWGCSNYPNCKHTEEI